MRVPYQLIQKVTHHLSHHHLRVATAESCTGGLLASYLTYLPGSSHWYDRGWITYSNEAKNALLGVSLSLIDHDGAVSLSVASAMVEGALKMSQADIAVAITGIAGPDGGSEAKPVGTVCFAWGKRSGEINVSQVHFPASARERIRYLACCEALSGLLKIL